MGGKYTTSNCSLSVQFKVVAKLLQEYGFQRGENSKRHIIESLSAMKIAVDPKSKRMQKARWSRMENQIDPEIEKRAKNKGGE